MTHLRPTYLAGGHKTYGSNLCMYEKLQGFWFERSNAAKFSVIPSNIAEGFELHTNRAFIRHLFIVKGSSGELRTQLYIAIRQNYIDQSVGTLMINLCKKLSGMIYHFILARKKQIRKTK